MIPTSVSTRPVPLPMRRSDARSPAGPSTLLKDAVRLGLADFRRLDDDPALDPIRDDPDFVNVMNEGHPGRRYAAVWSSDSSVESKVIEGVDPAGQLERARKLIARAIVPSPGRWRRPHPRARW